MKKRKISKLTALLFAAAILLLSVSGVSGTRAALQYYSETYRSRVQMYDIGVTLTENGNNISWRDYDTKKTDGSWNETKGVLLGTALAKNEELKLDHAYTEELAVANSGTIDQYVRVKVYRYWLDPDGNKAQDLSPDLIHLNLLTDKNGWFKDEDASTAERTVLYYENILKGSDSESDAAKRVTPLFADKLTIDGAIAAKVTQRQEGNKIISEYAYDGYSFMIEATVDAVQTHNAEEAIWSAWGKQVTIAKDGTLSF